LDPLLLLLLLALVVVVLVVVGVANRRRRDAALEPTRLGPSWSPDDEDVVDLAAEDEAIAERATELAASTELPRDTVETVLHVWREYLAVLGLTRLPASYRYRLYDPYNPPVARRDADGQPTPDRERVARDVGNRTEVSERDALQVLAADAALRTPGDRRH
jgi:hypothetical protein